MKLRFEHYSQQCTNVCKALVFCLFGATASTSAAQLLFEDVTDAAGFGLSGERWGISWGDINSDGYPDLLNTNHRDRVSIYRNNGNGTFTDIVLQVDLSGRLTLGGGSYGDTHGGAFADVDNDGDQDIYITATGTCCPDGIFLVNQGGAQGGILGTFIDGAASSGITDDNAGRLPAWFDYTQDGRLDLAAMNFSGVELYEQDAVPLLDFDPVDPGSVGLSCNANHNALLSDLNVDGSLDFVCVPRSGAFPQRVYDISTAGAFQDITSTVPSVSLVADAVTGDFDRNLRPDFFLVRGRTIPNEALKINDNRVEAWLVGSNFRELAFSFANSGQITIDMSFKGDDPNQVFIGSGGINPAGLPFTLDPGDASTHGINGGSGWGFYVGYDNVNQRWQILLRTQSSSRRGYVIVDTAETVSDLTTSGFQAADRPIKSSLLMNFPPPVGIVDEADSRGLGEKVLCNSAAVADFDNDMDEDIYLHCGGSVQNLPNRLYLNDGTGNFPDMLLFDWPGFVGAGLEAGVGTPESVAVADFDVDGAMDVALTNGMRLRPPKVGGPDQLLRNLGNSNHWIELDLVGAGPPNSNRDGIGAKVFATAGGITQLREQNGAYHRWSQNHQRIHFGLASNTTVDITVEWPSGITDTFTGVAADQLYQVSEGGAITALTPLAPAVGFPQPQPGDECGPAADYDERLDKAFFVWRDCASGEWFARVTAGGGSNTRYEGNVVAEDGFASVTAVDVESNDTVSEGAQELTFSLGVAGGAEDGFNFLLSSSGSCPSITVEGEDGALTGNFAVFADAGASGGSYVAVPIGLGDDYSDPPSQTNLGSAASYQVEVSESGAYRIDAVVLGPSSGSNSFWVQVDDGPFWLFDTDESGSYVTDPVSDRNGDDPVVVQLAAGVHEINFYFREDGTRLDRFTLVAQNCAATSNGCLTVVQPADARLLLGDGALPAPNPLDLNTLAQCVLPSGLSIDDVQVNEDDVTAQASFTVTLSPAGSQPVTVDYSSADGSALAGIDYLSVADTLTFNIGETTKVIQVPILDDQVIEAPETFSVNLTNPVNANVFDGSGTGTIIDDESPSGTAEIGDYVWDDANGDGIQDAGEDGFQAVAVNLLDCGNQLIRSTATDVNGRYVFDSLAAGSYKIEFTAPAGFGFSPQFQGPGAKDSNPNQATGRTGCLAMAEQQVRSGIDAGIVAGGGAPGALIGDFVWHDQNTDGLQTAGEPGVAGVTVNLLDCAGLEMATTTTGIDGAYSFDNLTAGGYRVEFELPLDFSGFSPQFQGPGGSDSNPNPGTGRTGCLPMAEGQQRVGIDAGLTQ